MLNQANQIAELTVCLLLEAGFTESHLTDEYTSSMANEIQAAIRLLEAERNRIEMSFIAKRN